MSGAFYASGRDYVDVPTRKVWLTRAQVDRILEWSTAAGDAWGDEWCEVDEAIVEVLESHQ